MSMEEKTQSSTSLNTRIGMIKQLIIIRKDLDVGLERIMEASNEHYGYSRERGDRLEKV